MAHAAKGQSPVKVQTYLKGVDYPTSKDKLIEAAKGNGAPREVMDLLQQLPADRFTGPDDVMRAYGEVK